MGRIADALRRAGQEKGTALPNDPAVPADDPTIDLTRLTSLIETLQHATAELRHALSTIEAALGSLHSGVEVWLVDHPLPPAASEPEAHEETARHLVRELGYCAWDDHWGLALRTVRRDRSADEGAHTIIDRRELKLCDRHDQIAAGDLIPHLVERMAEQVAESIARIERVKRTATALGRIARPPAINPQHESWEIL